MTRKYKIAFLNGDGIGQEVVPCAKRVLEASASKTGLFLELLNLPIGMEAYNKFGRTMPPSTVETLKECDGWLLGPLQPGSYPKDDPDYPMASGKIRKAFDLYANIRPFRSYEGIKGPLLNRNPIDFVIVRENTEDFYPDRNLFKGYGEFWTDPDTVLSLRVITRRASSRIAKTAFALAEKREKKRLTVVHKSNVLIEGDGLFLEEVRKEAKNHPSIALEEGLVDFIAMKLIQQPERYDIILTPNLFGDILSDEAAALIGGLGVAPSLNAGDHSAMAQSVHGSAPDIAEKGIANPTAEILSVAMLLEWLFAKHGDVEFRKSSEIIKLAIESQLASRNPEDKTFDLAGTASTNEFANRVLQRIESNLTIPM
jgi:3-isopropylmalate dehydrogenase